MAKKARKARAKKKKSAIKKIKRLFRTEKAARKSAATIEFCDKCASIMVPVKRGKSTHLKCRRCGAEKRKDIKALKIVESKKKTKGVTILEKDTTPLPMVEMRCEKCNNSHAYFWLQQTRSADEPPTQFFRCTKCKYTWREYK